MSKKPPLQNQRFKWWEHVTSVQFHEKMGYKHAGELKDCGYKFNRWYALLYMDKQIGIPQEEMSPIRDFDEVREKFGL